MKQHLVITLEGNKEQMQRLLGNVSKAVEYLVGHDAVMEGAKVRMHLNAPEFQPPRAVLMAIIKSYEEGLIDLNDAAYLAENSWTGHERP